MKHFVLALLVIIISVTCVYASNDNRRGDRDKSQNDRDQVQVDEIIYDLTIPWPFRKPHGVDSDGDGVTDANDRCPGTPSSARVDRFGCPISETETVFLDTGSITLYDIEFDKDEATLKSSSYDPLNEIGKTIENWPELKVEIAGHTDSQGETDFNQDLSERRAQTVRSYLLEKFDIEEGQLVAVGYGERNPVASNDTEDGSAKNRRVEFKVLNKKALKK